MNISVIGTGYVGLVSGACLASLGHRVTCVDRLDGPVEAINGGRSPLAEPGLEALVSAGASSGRLTATTDLASAIDRSEVTFITVGTPDRDGEIDLAQVRSAAAAIGQRLKSKSTYHLVAVKSTVVPGTTDGPVREELERASGKKAGRDFGLCMNPEFLREGEAVEDFMHPDRIVIGSIDQRSAETLSAVYGSFDCPVMVTSLRNAEFIKYASNAFLAVCVSFANELAGLCEHVAGSDAELVLDGLQLDRRLSPIVDGARIRPGILSYLRPGSGYGGSCLPKDVAALRGFARRRGLPVPLLDAVSEVNAARAARVLDLAEDRLGTVDGRRIALLGLSFKAGTDDVRDSPAVALAGMLAGRGASVVVFDPISTELAKPLLGESVTYAAEALEAITGVDIVVIGADWPHWRSLDWNRAAGLMRGDIVFDPRNALRNMALPPNLRRLGIGAGPATGEA